MKITKKIRFLPTVVICVSLKRISISHNFKLINKYLDDDWSGVWSPVLQAVLDRLPYNKNHGRGGQSGMQFTNIFILCLQYLFCIVLKLYLHLRTK